MPMPRSGREDMWRLLASIAMLAATTVAWARRRAEIHIRAVTTRPGGVGDVRRRPPARMRHSAAADRIAIPAARNVTFAIRSVRSCR
ncbi:hypothetical protein GCM10010106_11200 [Thermopolyspora flexuosa]|nr:hypothetical protein GCM10010106_11200 [Thermopolyspora flexuosa]